MEKRERDRESQVLNCRAAFPLSESQSSFSLRFVHFNSIIIVVIERALRRLDLLVSLLDNVVVVVVARSCWCVFKLLFSRSHLETWKEEAKSASSSFSPMPPLI